MSGIDGNFILYNNMQYRCGYCDLLGHKYEHANIFLGVSVSVSVMLRAPQYGGHWKKANVL